MARTPPHPNRGGQKAWKRDPATNRMVPDMAKSLPPDERKRLPPVKNAPARPRRTPGG
jgi:hypothetical protein